MLLSLMLRHTVSKPYISKPLKVLESLRYLFDFEISFLSFHIVTVLFGARGGVVIKTLRYKPTGRGFDSRWRHWNFLVT